MSKRILAIRTHSPNSKLKIIKQESLSDFAHREIGHLNIIEVMKERKRLIPIRKFSSSEKYHTWKLERLKKGKWKVNNDCRYDLQTKKLRLQKEINLTMAILITIRTKCPVCEGKLITYDCQDKIEIKCSHCEFKKEYINDKI